MADWTCSYCGATNGPNHSYCVKCGAGSLGGTTGVGASGKAPDWHCPRCQTVNAGSAQACTTCRGPQSPASNIGSPVPVPAATTIAAVVTRPSGPTATGYGNQGASPPGSNTQASAAPGGTAADSGTSLGRGPLLAVGAVAAILAVVLVVVLTNSGHATATYVPRAAPATTTTLAPSSTATTPLTVTAESQSLADLVSMSTDQRANVSSAANDLENCGNPSADKVAFTQAASVRQSVVNQLGTHQVSQIPNGTEMVQDLSRALNYSIQSDNSYAQWAADELTGCSTDYATDSNFAAAQQTDPQATAQKQAFTNLWNAVAPQYGLPVLDPTKI